jgi:pimeloyl-ACP methyl ester carboxylesterase
MFTSVRGYDLYHRSVGAGVPVVAIHGFGVDHHIMFHSQEPVFRHRQGYRRIYFDLPGMGRSKGEMPQNSDEMLLLVQGFIDSVIPEERFLLTGASYGAYLARGIVLRWPKRVLGLMMPVPLIEADRRKRTLPPRIVIKQDRELLASLSSEDREEFSSTATVQDEAVWKRYEEAVLPGTRAVDLERLSRFQATGYEFTFDVDEGGEPFPAPTLMLMGRQDNVVGFADSRRIVDRYPRASVVILDRASHALEMEQPALFRALLCEWLDRVEEWIGEGPDPRSEGRAKARTFK